MVGALVAALVAVAWCGVAIWLGPRIGFVDRPDRSSLTAHSRPVVTLGGVGIYLGVHVAAVSRGEVDMTLLAASTLILVLGLIDDRLGLSPVVRLIFQLLAGLILVLWGPLADSGLWFAVMGVGLVVIAVNAVNLYDGLDGLAGLSALVSALGLALLLGMGGVSASLPLELAAALGGFLLFNWHPARLFLGNSGAYVTGLLLAYLVLDATIPSSPDALLVSAVLGVFLIDLAASVLRRLRAGGHLMAGDRSHLYDQLRDRGLSVPLLASMSAFVQGVLVLAVVGVVRLVPVETGLVTMSALFAAILALLARAGFLTPRSG